MKRSLLLLLAGSLLAAPAFSAITQLVLAPSNVIGGSGSYGGTWDSGIFNATLILNQQAGAISEPDQPNRYWLNPDDGPVAAYIVIDLGAAYRLDSLQLFNTHNANFNDRGTGNFNFQAGNAVTNLGALGFDLSGPVTTIVSGSLLGVTQANDPITGQSFAIGDTNTYRYLRFNPTSVTVGGSPCCGTNVYGLNELRVYTNDELSSVPEPATFGVLGAGMAAIVAFARRRRTFKK